MANPTATVSRYIGGGRLFFTPYENGAYGADIEIGEVKDFSLNIALTSADAISQDSGPELVVEDVVTKSDAKVSFTTQNLNDNNRALAHMGTLTSEVFAIGDTLPDGTVATEETTVAKIIGMDKTQLKGKLRVVSEPINDSAKRPVLIIPMCSVRPSASVGYIMTDFAKLQFEGKAQNTADGFFTEYVMDIA